MKSHSWLLVVVIILTTAASLNAAKHPVPLDKNVTDAKCLECHEDKSKGKKIVHAAVQAGCQTCHLVRGSGEETRIVLKNTRIVTLCSSCHADKKQSSPLTPVHSPVTQDCIQCHDPHVSDNKGLLKKSTSGDKNANLCLTCHTQGLNVPEKGSRHAALDAGCDSCHVTHKSGERGKPEFAFHLTKTAPALCLDCHDAKDQALQKKHNGQPFATANCVQCHDPHQSASPKLMQANQHAPFEDKTGCATCHEAPKDGKVTLTQADSKALCATCHDEVAKKIETAKVQHPGAQGECVACHDPHAGKTAKFLKPNGVEACLSCHSDQAEMVTKKAVLHDPVFNQQCNICHDAHGGTREKLLKADVDDLCMSCHSNGAKGLKAQDGKTETTLNKAITLPVGYIDKAPHIILGTTTSLGHPVPGHPVSGKDLRDPTKQMSCVTCHNPHGGEAKNMLVSKAGDVRELCATCHINMKPGPLEKYKGPK